MAAQRGKDMLLKVRDDTGAFITVAGLRSRRIAFDAETVDVTHTESAGRWRELLSGAGVKRATITGAGVFKDAASDALARRPSSTARSATGRSSFPILASCRGRSRSPASTIAASTRARSPSR